MKGENPIRIRILELLAEGRRPEIEGLPKATVDYHLKYLSRSGYIRKGKLTPKGIAYYLDLVEAGLAIKPGGLIRRAALWMNGLEAHLLFATALVAIYGLVKGRAFLVFHIVEGSFILSLTSFCIYAGLLFALSSLSASRPFFPASYAGLLVVTFWSFFPLNGIYRLGYALAQALSLLLCSEFMYRSARIGRYRALLFNLIFYSAGLILYW